MIRGSFPDSAKSSYGVAVEPDLDDLTSMQLLGAKLAAKVAGLLKEKAQQGKVIEEIRTDATQGIDLALEGVRELNETIAAKEESLEEAEAEAGRLRKARKADRMARRLFAQSVARRDLWGLMEVARNHNMRPGLFVKWLRREGIIFGKDRLPKQKYKDLDYFEMRDEGIINGRKRFTTCFTTKGYVWILKKLGIAVPPVLPPPQGGPPPTGGGGKTRTSEDLKFRLVKKPGK